MNKEDDFLSRAHVAVLGLGLMGGSIALALRGRCRTLTAIDPDPAVLNLAARMNLGAVLALEPAGALAAADLIILAAPVRQILNLLNQLPGLHPQAPIVLDIGSTKANILQAMDRLPARFIPLGGHPICGKEKGSLKEADPALYHNAPFVFCPLPRTSQLARRVAVELAQTLGALPLWMDAASHDRWIASSSHLPYLLANALAASTPPEAKPLIGPGFRSTTRVGATPSAMMLDVLLTNRENILAAAAAFTSCFEQLTGLLERRDEAGLLQLLDEGSASQISLVLPSGGPSCN